MNQHAAMKSMNAALRSEQRTYSYRHAISFEETNVVGNVYFSHYISWQGRCRELFLRDYAPDVLEQLQNDLRLVTLNVSCDYFAELRALDEVEIEMGLAHLRQHRIGLTFKYSTHPPGSEVLVARGRHFCSRSSLGSALRWRLGRGPPNLTVARSSRRCTKGRGPTPR